MRPETAGQDVGSSPSFSCSSTSAGLLSPSEIAAAGRTLHGSKCSIVFFFATFVCYFRSQPLNLYAVKVNKAGVQLSNLKAEANKE